MKKTADDHLDDIDCNFSQNTDVEGLKLLANVMLLETRDIIKLLAHLKPNSVPTQVNFEINNAKITAAQLSFINLVADH